MNRRSIVIAVLYVTAPCSSHAQAPWQGSHILENVPPHEVFHSILQRDLRAFAERSGYNSVTGIQYTLLRDAPTQSGVSYPKYYVWLQVQSGSTVLVEGAARVLAIDRVRFEVANFLTVQQLRTTPSEAESVFPAPLVAGILSRAAAK
jgi:hypothetical protein